MQTADVVTSNPDILGGTPCFTGTRVTVDVLFQHLAKGYTVEYSLSEFPTVSREQATAAVELASTLIGHDATTR